MGVVGEACLRLVHMSIELNRLRWRARRGTRELDQVLGWWLDQRYAQADDVARAAFAVLLDQQDPDLWNWVLGQGRPDDAAQAALIDEIRARHRI